MKITDLIKRLKKDKESKKATQPKPEPVFFISPEF